MVRALHTVRLFDPMEVPVICWPLRRALTCTRYPRPCRSSRR
jgi:hypothetical protein